MPKAQRAAKVGFWSFLEGREIESGLHRRPNYSMQTRSITSELLRRKKQPDGHGYLSDISFELVPFE